MIAPMAARVFICADSPNAKVSDGGGPRAPELADKRRPPPFARPSCWRDLSPLVVLRCEHPSGRIVNGDEPVSALRGIVRYNLPEIRAPKEALFSPCVHLGG